MTDGELSGGMSRVNLPGVCVYVSSGSGAYRHTSQEGCLEREHAYWMLGEGLGWHRFLTPPQRWDYDFTTRRLLITLNTPGTPLAWMPATFLSVWLSTTPSSVTTPFLTMMWMGGSGPHA